jgi:predicted RNase H-like HicB family nuclease
MTSYIAIIHKDKGSDYGVSFPDFPGCISAGSNLDEARAMGQEALEAYTDFLQEEGHELPAPMSLEDAIKASRDLAKIDRYAKSHGLTRSAFLIQAAQKMIQRGA